MTNGKMNEMAAVRKMAEANGSDVLRHLLQQTVQQLMGAEIDGLCGAEHRTRSAERENCRNGYRSRPWDTRLGLIDLQIPRLRQGTYFPDWALEPRKRAEKALYEVVAECYVLGVSTRRVDRLVKAFGLDGIDKSRVSRMSEELDQQVKEFRERPLDASPFRYVWVDALHIKVREGGRIVSAAVGIATAVNTDGRREIIGLDVFTTEDGASWTSFLRGLVARGLKGVELVVSDCHFGLKAAIEAVLPSASWQRCRTHMVRNLLSHVPRHAQDMVASLTRSVFAQPDADTVRKQFVRVVDQLNGTGFAKASEILADAQEDLLAFCAFPKAHWRQIWSNNPQERLNKEVRRRTDVVGIFPSRAAIIRLVGAVLAEQHDEWQVSRCYMSFDKAAPSRQDLPPVDNQALTSHKESR